jgi:hypothetical protein
MNFEWIPELHWQLGCVRGGRPVGRKRTRSGAQPRFSRPRASRPCSPPSPPRYMYFWLLAVGLATVMVTLMVVMGRR